MNEKRRVHGEQTYAIRGRLAVVTGGGGGIGRAVALGLGDAGLDVGVVDVAAEAAEHTVELVRSLGRRAEAFEANLSVETEAERVVGDIERQLGAIDILVNCAGVYPRSSVLEMPPQEWDLVLSVNLKSILMLAKAVLPGMVDRGYGRIISFTSDLGSSGIPRGSHYAASKAGLNVFTRSLAREIETEDVTVNAVAPGATDTSMLRNSNTPEYIESVARSSVLGRIGRPDEVVGMVLFLTSDAASTISGQVLGLRM